MFARRFCFALLALVVHASVAHSQGATSDHSHDEEMLVSGDPQAINIYDPRLSVQQILYTPVGDNVLIEGDIVMGTVDEINAAFLEHAADAATRVLADEKAAGAISEEQRETLEQALPLKGQSAETAGDAEYGVANRALILVDDLNKAPSPDFGDLRQESAIIVAGENNKFRWPKGVIPYVIAADCPNQDLINEAINHWHARTDRIRLVKRTDANQASFKNWVRFVGSTGCSSRVGKKPTEGEQTINLGAGCLTPQIIHEIGHAVGLFHEQSRNDRDGVLIVNTSNIAADKLFNFNLILAGGIDVGLFDFKSIMLYPSRAFSSNNEPSMTRRDNENDVSWGIATGALGGTTTTLSDGDIAGVAAMYPNPAEPPAP